MNLRKILFASVLVLSFSLAACDDGGTSYLYYDELQYSNEWSYNDYKHWHQCITPGYENWTNDDEYHRFETVVVEATYDEPGYYCSKCSVCGYVEYQYSLDKKEHNYSSAWSYDSSSHWRNCVDAGYTDLKGSVGKHDFETRVVEPTYDSEGYTIFTCRTCGYTTKKDETPALTHHYSKEYQYDERYHWQTCTDSGYSYLVRNKTEHAFVDEVIPPTFEEPGYTIRTCSVCGYSYNDSPTEVLPHNYANSWTYNETNHWHDCIDEGYSSLQKDYSKHTFTSEVTPPTYVEKGFTTHTCSVCGYSYKDNEVDRLTYTVRWENYDGTLLSSQNYYLNDIPSYSDIPTRDFEDDYYYVFEGWSPEVGPVTGDATYVAQFSKQQSTDFVIKYNANGGSGAPNSQEKHIGDSITLSSVTPTYSGHVFLGWNNKFEDKIYQSGDSFNLDHNVTLWAMWGTICSNCNGTGKYSYKSSCYKCYGHGKVCSSCGSASITLVYNSSTGTHSEACGSCGSKSFKTCPTCGGTGGSTVTETCSSCGGVGYYGCDAPTVSSYEARKITLTSKSGYEYSIDKKNWQSGPVFDNLLPSTTYTFYQRVATNGNIPFGVASVPLKATTSYTSTYYVTYDLNGGTNNPSNPSTYSSNSSTTTLYEPTKEHYNFAGWTYNGSKVTAIQGSWEKDITLVATWTYKAYPIDYNLDGGTNNSKNPLSHGLDSEDIILEDPTKNGYTFIGWTGSNGETPEKNVLIPAGSTGDLSYTANWQLNTYTISYDLNGGDSNGSNPTTYTVNDANIVLGAPSRFGYTFLGWKKVNSSSYLSRIYTYEATNISLVAFWKATDYPIEYNLDGGTNNPSNPLTHSIESEDIALSAPTRDGYTFTGWTGSNGDTPETNVTIEAGNTNQLSYTANWSLDIYSITYHLDGGTNHIKNPSSYTIEDTIALKDASKDYYSFDGWYLEPEFINRVGTLNGRFGNLDLYAKFIPFSYNSTFNANNGSIQFKITANYCNGSSPVITIVHAGESFDPYTLNIPSRNGFIFGGWYFDAEYTNPINSSYAIDRDTTLYARWLSASSSYDPLTTYKQAYGHGESSQNGGNYSSNIYFYIPYTITGEVDVYCQLTNTGYYGLSSSATATLTDVTANSTIYSKNTSSNFEETKTINLIQGHVYKLYATGTYSSKYDSSLGYSKYHQGHATIKVTSKANVSIPLTCFDSYTQSFEQSIIMPTSAYRSGYDFEGWYDENDELIHDIWDYTTDKEFHAEWSTHTYTISYNLNGGINNPLNPVSFTKDDTINLQDPTREGYEFIGWFTDSSFSNKVTTLNGSSKQDYVLYAKWSPIWVSVSLDYDGGEVPPTTYFYSNGELVQTFVGFEGSYLLSFVPEPPSEGMVFAGWHQGSVSGEYFKNSFPRQDTYLYAKWIDSNGYEVIDCASPSKNVSIDGNEYRYLILVSMADQDISVYSTSELDLFGAIYDSNWQMIASNDDASDWNLNFRMNNIHLEAGGVYYIAYKANQASVSGSAVINIDNLQYSSFLVNGCAASSSAYYVSMFTAYYDSAFTLPTPQKEGYVFLGWYDAEGNPIDTNVWNIVPQYDETYHMYRCVLYAHWAPAP